MIQSITEAASRSTARQGSLLAGGGTESTLSLTKTLIDMDEAADVQIVHPFSPSSAVESQS